MAKGSCLREIRYSGQQLIFWIRYYHNMRFKPFLGHSIFSKCVLTLLTQGDLGILTDKQASDIYWFC